MLGDLFVYDQKGDLKYSCYTLEDEKRDIKVQGETAIPAGEYEIKLRPLGQSRMDAAYSNRYPFYRGQLWLQDVPNFTYVYIHTGNNDDHTDGCILIGKTKYEDTIGSSRDAYRELYPLMADAIASKERVSIEVIDA